MKKMIAIIPAVLSLVVGATWLPSAHAAIITISPYFPGSGTVGSATPGGYVKNFYQFALFIGGILAFAVIVYGGIKRAISAGNPSATSEANEWIKSALLGLLLLASAYLILFTINPNLVDLSLTLPSIPAGQTNGTGGDKGGGVGLSQSTALPELGPNFSLKPGASIDGIQQDTVDDLINLQGQCATASGGSCPVVITSGTDSHDTGTCHANGEKADLRSGGSLDSFITSLPKGPIRKDGAQLYYFGGGTIADERHLSGVSPHWDLSAISGCQ